jgi:hypothetical protein
VELVLFSLPNRARVFDQPPSFPRAVIVLGCTRFIVICCYHASTSSPPDLPFHQPPTTNNIYQSSQTISETTMATALADDVPRYAHATIESLGPEDFETASIRSIRSAAPSYSKHLV